MSARKTLSWKPIRRGKIYCSAACGGGCTHDAYLEAKRDANAEARAMGKGWKPSVWENLGWHHKIISPCRRLEVINHGDSYTAYLNKPGRGGGRWAEHGLTAKFAVRNVLRMARAEIAELQSIVEGL